MRFLFFIASILFKLALFAGGPLLIEGKYQNRNIYVQNGFDNGIGFCVYEVRVNGKITTDEISSSAFEIDFTPFRLKVGDSVKVEIFHKDGCLPRILNPDVLKSKPTCEFINPQVNDQGYLVWKTKNESGSLPFIIQQYKWNRWVKIGEVTGIGSPEINSYEFKVEPHSGTNKFQIKQTGAGLIPKITKPILYTSTNPQPAFRLSKNQKEIIFTAETSFEVYDLYGKIVKKGHGVKIDLNNVPKGNYFLCYDSVTAEFEKKKK